MAATSTPLASADQLSALRTQLNEARRYMDRLEVSILALRSHIGKCLTAVESASDTLKALQMHQNTKAAT